VLCLPRGVELRPRRGEDLLACALRQGVPLASSCGGRAVCGDCLVRVLSGEGHVSPAGPQEQAWRARTGRRDPGRLACRLEVCGRVEVTTTYW